MREDYRLKAVLDNGRTDEVLVCGYIGYPGFRVQNHASLSELNPVLTVIACMYKLIKANPLRFWELPFDVENELVWGIHHENWQRAHAVIHFIKYRRTDFAHCPDAGPRKYENSKLYEPRCYAYATPDLIASVAARQGSIVSDGEDESVDSMDDL